MFNQNTNDLPLDDLIDLIENNYGFGRRVGENEAKRLIEKIKQLQTTIDYLLINDKI